jgi:hypothetical protein
VRVGGCQLDWAWIGLVRVDISLSEKLVGVWEYISLVHSFMKYLVRDVVTLLCA